MHRFCFKGGTTLRGLQSSSGQLRGEQLSELLVEVDHSLSNDIIVGICVLK